MNNLYKSSLPQSNEGSIIKDVYSDTLEEDLHQINKAKSNFMAINPN